MVFVFLFTSSFRKHTLQNLPSELLRSAKQLGMSDRQVGAAIGAAELAVRKVRVERSIMPFVKQIDTGKSLT
jgi:hypothetical protein